MSTIHEMWENGSLVGERVEVCGQVRSVRGLYADTPGGVVLDEPIEGFRSWNIDELRLVNDESANQL